MKEKRNWQCKFTIQEEMNIIKEYQKGNSYRDLGKKYGCDPSTIGNILKAYESEARTLSQARRNFLNYTLNEDVFSKIDTPDKAYWLGVMYSDGYISKTNKYTNYFGLTIAKKDREWLEKMKSFLNYSGEIKEYLTTESSYVKNSPYVKLLIGNNKIVKDLEKWGVVEHKTTKINSLPPIDFLDDFIRGYIDGDGSLLKKRPCFQISGNKDFLLKIASYFNIPYSLYVDKTIYSLRYSSKQSEYLEKRLYSNANYYLQRKYDIATRSFNSPLTLEDVR